jgi:hypothetical protein
MKVWDDMEVLPVTQFAYVESNDYNRPYLGRAVA